MPSPSNSPSAVRQPNILVILTDQERSRSWIPKGVPLPNRQRLLAQGLEFTDYYTHSSPCSPSRATLLTGLYVPQHGVVENTNRKNRKVLDPQIPTLGHLLRKQGYYTGYKGKWHISRTPTPDMDAFGFSDWEGNDDHYIGIAGTGTRQDPRIASQAARWITNRASSTQPWFLFTSLVNPHDILGYPADQEDYQAAHPAEVQERYARLPMHMYGDEGVPPPVKANYARYFDRLPVSHHDDLTKKPTVHQTWGGRHTRHTEQEWIRMQDYYLWLHQESDRSIGLILDALDASGAYDNTIIIFTADHGDMCGAHGLTGKGPFVYEEIMHVPLYVRVPGVTKPGSKTAALASHIDLARTVLELGGAGQTTAAGDLPGEDLTPIFKTPSTRGREEVLFAQDMPWTEANIPLRYAIRSLFDGRYKYARYYGVGGGLKNNGEPWPTPMQVGVNAPFEEQEHELYDLQEDPHELVNLAHDMGAAKKLRACFDRLKELEAVKFKALA